jgi:hypothetical protein
MVFLSGQIRQRPTHGLTTNKYKTAQIVHDDGEFSTFDEHGEIISTNAAEGLFSRVKRFLRITKCTKITKRTYGEHLGEFLWRERFLSSHSLNGSNWRDQVFWILVEHLSETTKAKMVAKVPGRHLLEVPDKLQEEFSALKTVDVLRDPFALPDPPPLLPAYRNLDLDVPDLPSSGDENDGAQDISNGDRTPQGDNAGESGDDMVQIDVEIPVAEVRLADGLWDDQDWVFPEVLTLPMPAEDMVSSSPELSPEPAPRVLRPRVRGIRGRGRGRAQAQAKRNPRVAVALPAFSEAQKITKARKYEVEYFGGDRPGTFRVLEFRYRFEGNLRCEHQGPHPHVKTYRPDRIGRVRELPDPSSGSMSRAEAVRLPRRPNLRAAAFE